MQVTVLAWCTLDWRDKKTPEEKPGRQAETQGASQRHIIKVIFAIWRLLVSLGATTPRIASFPLTPKHYDKAWKTFTIERAGCYETPWTKL